MIEFIRKNSFAVKGCCGFLAVVLFLFVFGWVVSDSWTDTGTELSSVTGQTLLQPLTETSVIEQKFSFSADKLTDITLYTGSTGRCAGTLEVEVLAEGTAAAYGQVALEALESVQSIVIPVAQTGEIAGKELTLRVTAAGLAQDSYLALYWGDTVQSGKFQFSASDVDGFTVNGEAVKGHLDMTVTGRTLHPRIMTYYACACGAVLVIYVIVILRLWHCRKTGGKNIILQTYDTLRRYSFLIQQFVARDFNTKYRQSLLGVVWSFLNPLLTMGVQYVVFSKLFSSSIDYFVVYLLSGIIMFNYFSEACGMGMESITSNGYLINKVFVPKFIYPFSRIISSLINLLISLVPLFAVMLISGLPVTKALLLIPIPIIFMVIFAYGMSLLLCTSNVFFRDTRFLWGVVAMLWNFLTPIFYPESIVPESLVRLYHMNPMYQFIYFVRCVIINGVTPQPINYLYCALCAFVPFLLGLWVFKKNQNKFILYI